MFLCSSLTPGVWRTHSLSWEFPGCFQLPSGGRGSLWDLFARNRAIVQILSATFQKYLLRDFLVFCVPAGLGGLLLCARAALTKKEDELAFPLNQSIFTLPGKLLKCCCSLVFGVCFSCLAGILPQSLPHWQLLFVQQGHVGVPKDGVGGTFQGLPGHVCIFSSACGVRSSPSAPRKAGAGEGEAMGSLI